MGSQQVDELNELFAASAPGGLQPDVLAELESMLRLHSIPPQELFYKWESYSMKMGDDTRLNIDTVRAFKKDVQEILERESRGKATNRSAQRGAVQATPRAINSSSDVLGILDGFSPYGANSNGSNSKRKADFSTPSAKTIKAERGGSPSEGKRTPAVDGSGVAFLDRKNAGQVVESLNSHLSLPEAPIAPYSEPRIKPTANTDLKKFAYKPMGMKLSEASEMLDDRIDDFMNIIQAHHQLEDSAFGNAATQSTSEIVVVGRIASDSMEGKLNTASLVLETSRRMGAGLRVPLRLDSLPGIQFFPGQIVAFRGKNASGQYFSVSEILSAPLLHPAASSPASIEATNERLDNIGGQQPLNIIYASGPYTADDNLEFEPLQALCQKCESDSVDALVMTGPFLDLEHPLVASGDFDLPEIKGIDPDAVTLTTFFRHAISRHLQALATAVPNITIIMVPSVRDAVSKHVSWPQEQLPKKELGLPKPVRIVSNPVILSLNEVVVAITSQDIMYELRREEVLGGKPTESNLLARLPKYLIEQRHFSPLYPPTARTNLPKSGTEDGVAIGSMLDLSYLRLGEWGNVRPDVLLIPSALPPFVKVVDGVLAINPGTLSKRKAAGTYSQMSLHPRTMSAEEREQKSLMHKVYERARVDVVRI